MEFNFCGRRFLIEAVGEDRKYTYYDIMDYKEIFVCSQVEVKKKKDGLNCISIRKSYEEEVPLILAIVQMAVHESLFPRGEYYLKIGGEGYRDRILKLSKGFFG